MEEDEKKHAVKQAADEEEQEAKDARKEERQAKRAKRDDEEREKNEKIRRITAAIDRTIEWAERDQGGPDDWNMIKMQKLGRLQSALVSEGEDFKVTRATHPRIREAKDEISRLEALEKNDDPDDRTAAARVKHEQAVNGFLSQWRAMFVGMFDSMVASGESPSDLELTELIESMAKKF